MWGENMGFIYKITNDVNGKVYIGKTLNTVESRWKEHCHDKDRRNMENRPLCGLGFSTTIRNSLVVNVKTATTSQYMKILF